MLKKNDKGLDEPIMLEISNAINTGDNLSQYTLDILTKLINKE